MMNASGGKYITGLLIKLLVLHKRSERFTPAKIWERTLQEWYKL